MSESPQPRPLTIFGEVLFDWFEDGTRVLGGAPFNVAWHAQALGGEPLFVSAVGDDAPGQKVEAAMERWGMTRAGLRRDPEHGTGEVRVHIERGEPNYEIVDDRAWDHIDTSDLALPQRPDGLLYHGTLALRAEPNRDALEALLARGFATVFVDVNLRVPYWSLDLVQRCIERAQVVKLNVDELDALAPGTERLRLRAEAFRAAHGLDALIVTRGARGALVASAEGVVEQPLKRPPKVVDTVGAGDAFASVCLIGLSRGWSWLHILQRAQHFAAIVVGQRGATAENPRAYRELRQRWGIEAPTRP